MFVCVCVCARICICINKEALTPFSTYLLPAAEQLATLVVVAAVQQDMMDDVSPQDIASPPNPEPTPLISGLATLLRDDDTLDTTDPDRICLCCLLILLLWILLQPQLPSHTTCQHVQSMCVHTMYIGWVQVVYIVSCTTRHKSTLNSASHPSVGIDQCPVATTK